jgi:uncharacterized tellurite resistance protein B-like protein
MDCDRPLVIRAADGIAIHKKSGGPCMFAAFKQLLTEITEGEKPAARFDDNDYRLSASAHLVQTATIAGRFSDAQRDRLHATLKKNFALDDATTDELVEEATEVERDAVDLYHFTRLLNRSLDEDGRRRIVEMMWEVIYADGRVSEFEDNLVWRAADLLGISRQTRIGLRHKVAHSRDPSDNTP